MNFTVERMSPRDWDAVKAIYREGISMGIATFEKDVPVWEEWDRSHLSGLRLVARASDKVVGWAALSPVSGRCVCAGVAEVSLYVSSSARGKGVGRALLQALVRGSEESGIWTLQAGIFPENVASTAVHESCGFRRVGVREKLGQLDGVWKDVVLMERRSRRI
ncbi:MAG: N-acetyltransferase [Candidatus Eiseniibacteriota bacterium]|nr:MAG: N-acetyltransferase [Candidatus Eisenbacteria bacterium]